MTEGPQLDGAVWRFVTDQEHFEKLKHAKSFAAIVALSRAISALRFVQNPLLMHEGKSSPAATRARLNSLFFSCSIYAESYLLIQRIKAHFYSCPSFQKLEDISIKNPEAKKLLGSSITALRNKLVFHFDVDEIGRQLDQMGSDEPTFLNAMGETNDQVHYSLADLCVLQALHEPTLTKADETNPKDFEEFANELSSLIIGFTDAAEKFIVDQLNLMGWHRENQGS
jgi:hypothetical protein